MLDLIRHPERTQITGFRLPDRVRHGPRRNDVLEDFQNFNEIIKVTLINFSL
jgi:hypothetical protein